MRVSGSSGPLVLPLHCCPQQDHGHPWGPPASRLLPVFLRVFHTGQMLPHWLGSRVTWGRLPSIPPPWHPCGEASCSRYKSKDSDFPPKAPPFMEAPTGLWPW